MALVYDGPARFATSEAGAGTSVASKRLRVLPPYCNGCPEPAPRRRRARTRAAAGRPLARFFIALLAQRWLVLAIYAILLPPAAFFASKVQQDNSVDRLIVATDPDFVATRRVRGGLRRRRVRVAPRRGRRPAGSGGRDPRRRDRARPRRHSRTSPSTRRSRSIARPRPASRRRPRAWPPSAASSREPTSSGSRV